MEGEKVRKIFTEEECETIVKFFKENITTLAKKSNSVEIIRRKRMKWDECARKVSEMGCPRTRREVKKKWDNICNETKNLMKRRQAGESVGLVRFYMEYAASNIFDKDYEFAEGETLIKPENDGFMDKDGDEIPDEREVQQQTHRTQHFTSSENEIIAMCFKENMALFTNCGNKEFNENKAAKWEECAQRCSDKTGNLRTAEMVRKRWQNIKEEARRYTKMALNGEEFRKFPAYITFVMEHIFKSREKIEEARGQFLAEEQVKKEEQAKKEENGDKFQDSFMDKFGDEIEAAREEEENNNWEQEKDQLHFEEEFKSEKLKHLAKKNNISVTKANEFIDVYEKYVKPSGSEINSKIFKDNLLPEGRRGKYGNKNFTKEECLLVSKFVIQNADILLNKSLKTFITERKIVKWRECASLCEKLRPSITRTGKEMKKKWKNIVLKARELITKYPNNPDFKKFAPPYIKLIVNSGKFDLTAVDIYNENPDTNPNEMEDSNYENENMDENGNNSKFSISSIKEEIIESKGRSSTDLFESNPTPQNDPLSRNSKRLHENFEQTIDVPELNTSNEEDLFSFQPQNPKRMKFIDQGGIGFNDPETIKLQKEVLLLKRESYKLELKKLNLQIELLEHEKRQKMANETENQD